MKVANPIYDIVFKYLMEDQRIARTILSALLKVDVLDVEIRPHEYSDDTRDTLSIFRIDFGATIRDATGHERMILIELQKTWLETETLRFRQYLGIHYSNPKNIQKDGSALPMVAVYLLGHKVGSIEEPVLYVNQQSCDYDGNIITKGLPNAFVDSLTHNSIIVQIPRLHGHINNRLERVLSIFDQSNRDKNDSRLLTIDDAMYENDADMRHKMNVEDEYYSIIEKRDTEILIRDKQLAEKEVLLTEKDAQLTEKDAQLTEQKAQLTEKDSMLRSTIRMLLDAGLSMDDIATKLGKDLEEIVT